MDCSSFGFNLMDWIRILVVKGWDFHWLYGIVLSSGLLLIVHVVLCMNFIVFLICFVVVLLILNLVSVVVGNEGFTFGFVLDSRFEKMIIKSVNDCLGFS